MNYIITDKSCISAFSDAIDADNHKHWMLQLFYAIDRDLLINAAGSEIKCKCIVVNTNIVHNFSTQSRLHFTMLIDCLSPIGLDIIEKFLRRNEYYVFDNDKLFNMQPDVLKQRSITIQFYEHFVSSLLDTIGVKMNSALNYNERIVKVIEQLKNCDCTDHSISEIASNVYISPSRLSHHFKEETGMSLKSYVLLHMAKKAYLVLLQNGNITNAALDAGFDSPSHFAATNKKLTGMSATNISKNSVFLKASCV